MAELTAFDIVVLLMVVVGAVTGLLRGFVTEVLSLAAWIAGIVALRALYDPAATLAEGLVGSRAGGAVLAFAVVFLVPFILVRMAASAVGGTTRNSLVGPVDRFLGFGFGALKGLIGASLLFLLIALVYDTAWGAGEPRPEWIEASRTYPLLRVSSEAIVDFVEERRYGPDEDRAAEEADGAADEGYSQRAREALDDLVGPGKS